MSRHRLEDHSRRNFISGRWRSTSSINASCLNMSAVFCQLCKEVCSEDAIVFKHASLGLQLPMILSQRCTACMDCVESCPSAAITIKNTTLHGVADG